MLKHPIFLLSNSSNVGIFSLSRGKLHSNLNLFLSCLFSIIVTLFITIDHFRLSLSQHPTISSPTFKNAGIFNFYKTVFNDLNTYSARINKHVKKPIGSEQDFKDFKTYQMSDHLPLWVEMNTDHAESYLGMIMNKPELIREETEKP